MATITERRDSKGHTTYQARIRKAGYPQRTQAFSSRAEAETWAEATESEMLARGPNSIPGEQAVTLGEVANLYLAQVDVPDEEMPEIHAISKSPIAHLLMADVSRQAVEHWASKLPGKLENKRVVILGDIIEKSRKDWGMNLPENPARALIAVPVVHRDRRLSSEEEKQLLESAALTRGGYMVDTIVLALETAMMQHEIISLDWSSVDIEHKIIRLDIPNDCRKIPLTDRAIETLTNRGIKKHGPVFPELTPEALKRSFIRTVQRANIEDLHFNDLRHEATCRLFEAGYTLEQVRFITGRKTFASLERYTALLRPRNGAI